MIEDIRTSTPEEREIQITYLEATPVSGLASLLRRGELDLKRGVVRSLAELGMLKTEFGELGQLRPPPMMGARKFRVAEVMPVLKANSEVDSLLRGKIEEFIRIDERGELIYNTTVLRHGEEYVVKDGNKRTIAFYERWQGSDDRIQFPIFLLEPARQAA